MSQKNTVVLDDDLIKKLREIQAKEIQKKLKPVSFSKVVNDALRKGL